MDKRIYEYIDEAIKLFEDDRPISSKEKLEMAEVFALASIAKSLEILVENGIAISPHQSREEFVL